MPDNKNLDRSILYGDVTLCADPAHVVEIAGQKLVPDDTKAYVKFRIAGSWPGRTAYGTTLHPSTVANSHTTLLHQLVNDHHLMKVHSDEPNARDHIIGSIVAEEYPPAPAAGWKLEKDGAAAPMITGAAVLFKQSQRVPDILREHLGGIHKWTVSQEIYFDRTQSGFVVQAPEGKPNKAGRELMATTTPEEFADLGVGYIPWMDAPEDLRQCYDPGPKGMKSEWQGCRVTLMKGGVNGQVHWGGVGLVRYGAEREAEIQDLLANHPDALFLAQYRNFLSHGKKVVDALRELGLGGVTQ